MVVLLSALVAGLLRFGFFRPVRIRARQPRPLVVDAQFWSVTREFVDDG